MWSLVWPLLVEQSVGEVYQLHFLPSCPCYGGSQWVPSDVLALLLGQEHTVSYSCLFHTVYKKHTVSYSCLFQPVYKTHTVSYSCLFQPVYKTQTVSYSCLFQPVYKTQTVRMNLIQPHYVSHKQKELKCICVYGISPSVYGIGYGVDIQWIGVWFLVGTRDTVPSVVPRLALEPTHHHIQWVPELSPCGK
jgi:hypothetical protein